MSQVTSPLTIIEGIFLDYDLYFQVMCGEHTKTFERLTKTLAPRTVDAIACGPNGNMQGGMRCYSLESCRVLQRSRRDVKIHKMPMEVIKRIDVIEKQKNSLKGLKFGDS